MATPVETVEAAVAEEAPAKPKRTRRKKADPTAEEAAAAEAAPETPAAEEAPAKPKRTRRKKADAVVEEVVVAEAAPSVETPSEAVSSETTETVTMDGEAEANGEGDDGTPRRGWWQRTFGQ